MIFTKPSMRTRVSFETVSRSGPRRCLPGLTPGLLVGLLLVPSPVPGNCVQQYLSLLEALTLPYPRGRVGCHTCVAASAACVVCGCAARLFKGAWRGLSSHPVRRPRPPYLSLETNKGVCTPHLPTPPSEPPLARCRAFSSWAAPPSTWGPTPSSWASGSPPRTSPACWHGGYRGGNLGDRRGIGGRGGGRGGARGGSWVSGLRAAWHLGWLYSGLPGGRVDLQVGAQAAPSLPSTPPAG